MKIISVVGARPNFMKMAPLSQAFATYPAIEHKIIHTGQHYDYSMNKLFFEQLGIPEPSEHLKVGSASHAKQTAEIMVRFEEILLKGNPDVVLVVGDVNSTLACSLTASKMHIPVVHVEAGLRSGDRNMPEEINRILTDHLSDLLFVSEESGLSNLEKEGISKDKIFFVGNVMIDSLISNLSKSDKSDILTQLKISSDKYGLVTLHRPSNVDSKERLSRLVALLTSIATDYLIVFPMHPRTKNSLTKLNLGEELFSNENIKILEPQGYFEFLKLMKESVFVLTDSGGIQEEASYLNIPCITIRDTTERPVTCTMGTNTLIPFDQIDMLESTLTDKLNNPKADVSIPKWDGKTSERIAQILVDKYVL